MKRFKKKTLNQPHKKLNNTTPSPSVHRPNKKPRKQHAPPNFQAKDQGQCQCRPTTSKILVNENVRNRLNHAPLQPQPNNNPCQCQCPLQPPLLPQRSQTPLMQMITLHPEQHIRHRNQRQCHKQVNPMPSHKRKPPQSTSPLSMPLQTIPPHPRYLSMIIHVLIHCPHSKAPCTKALTQPHQHQRPTNTPSSPPQKPPHTSSPTVRHDTPPAPR